jgi:tellurite resistance protein
MQVDRHNYEEYFLLYADDELGAEERKAVEQFATANPDLAAELDILLQSRLTPDHIVVFENKGQLIKEEKISFIDLTNYEEYLLSYIDNELNPDETSELEIFLSSHPRFKEELTVLQQAKLQADQSIVFPGKESLYQKEEPVRTSPFIIRMNFWKIAVAATLILAMSIGALTIIFKNKNSGTGGTVATIKPAPASGDKNNLNANKEEKIIDQVTKKDGNNNNLAATDNDRQRVDEQAPKKENKIGDQKQNKIITNPNDNPVAVTGVPVNTGKNEQPVNKTITDHREEDRSKIELPGNNIVTINPSNQNIASNPVTNKSGEPYNKETAPVKTSEETAPVFASHVKGKNRKLRGFFRKATRVFERTTRIGSPDNDEKLLIGGLAVKL